MKPERERLVCCLADWLIDHKIQYVDSNCHCNSNIPNDRLCELFELTGNMGIAETLKLSEEKVMEVVQSRRLKQ